MFNDLRDYPAGIAAFSKTVQLQYEEYGQLLRPRNWFKKLVGASPLSDEAIAWFRGVEGEKKTGQYLELLPEDYLVLHGVPIGSGESDIDHLVVGPSGIYSVNSKYHPNSKVWVSEKAFMVSGHRQPYLKNSRFEASRVSKIIAKFIDFPAHVEAVLAVYAESLTVKSQPAGIQVIEPQNLKKHILSRGVVFNPEQLESLKAVAVNASSWHTNPSALGIKDLAEQYKILSKAVRGAKVVRLLWIAAALLVLVFFVPEIFKAVTKLF